MIRIFLKTVFALILYASNFYSQTQLDKIEDVLLPPVSTFRNYCSRCHGEEGKSYGKNFGNLKDDSLKAMVEDMMFGPAGLNPKNVEIEAMVSYHKLLRNNKPFAAVINLKSFLDGKDKNLKIDASPNSVLEINNKGVKIQKNKNMWELSYDPAKIKNIKIVVKKNGSSSVLNLPDELWMQ